MMSDPPLDAHGSGASVCEQIDQQTAGTSGIGISLSMMKIFANFQIFAGLEYM